MDISNGPKMATRDILLHLESLLLPSNLTLLVAERHGPMPTLVAAPFVPPEPMSLAITENVVSGI
jgi:hypothetical protein